MSSLSSSADSIADQLASQTAVRPGDTGRIDHSAMAEARPVHASRSSRVGSTRSRRGSKAKARSSKSNSWAPIVMPLLLVMGLALCIPALWGTGILAGMDVPMAERHNARAMAMLMMVCWPLALFMMLVSGYLAVGLFSKSRA